MRQEYNKLVRDRIPDIIREDGRECGVEVMQESEYRQALLTKLIEEGTGAAEAQHKKLVVELADLYEVIDAVMVAHGLERETVLAEQGRRRKERGGFQDRIRLLWTE